MTTVDWIAAAVIAVAALNGLWRGLVGGAFSLAGIVVGAYRRREARATALPGTDSAYTPLVALAGAVAFGFLLQSLAAMAGNAVRSSLFVVPPLSALDSQPEGSCSAPSPARRSCGSPVRLRSTFPGRCSFGRRSSAHGSSGSSTRTCRRRGCSTQSLASTRSRRFSGPGTECPAARPRVAEQCGSAAGEPECLPRHRDGVRARGRRLGLGRRAESRRDERPRRCRDE